MHEDAPVVLVEVLDFSCLGVELHGAGDAGGEFFVGELDACDLWVEGARDEGAQEGVVVVVDVVCAVG